MNGLTSIKREALSPSATNPRKNFNPAKLQELAGTIKEHGVLEPLLVRALGNGRYEIIAGERRWRAAGLAGLQELPCIEKALTEQQVLEVQYIENLQRDDLSAIEEAEGFKKLIQSGAYTAETLATKLGKSRAHVFARLKLCKLDGPIREALSEGKISHLHAEDLAKWVPAPQQKEALKRVMRGPGYGGDPMSVREARDFLQRRYSTDLEDVAWDLKDKNLLLAAGPCTTCPKRSGNCKEEFPEIKSVSVCTDFECLNQKKQAHRAQLLSNQAKKGKTLTLAECDEIFDQYGSLKSDSGWTDLDLNIQTKAGWKRISDIVKKPKSECFAAVNADGEVSNLYRRKDLLLEVEAAGVKETAKVHKDEKRETAEDRAKREAKEKLEREVRTLTQKRLYIALRDRFEKGAESNATLEKAAWLLVLKFVHGTANWSDTSCDAIGFPEFGNVWDWEKMAAKAGKLSIPQLRAFTLLMACADDYQGQEVFEAAEMMRVDVKGISKKVREELTVKAKETLVHKVTHGKPLPGEKKAAKPARKIVERNGHSKELPEQPGLRGFFTVADQPADPPRKTMTPAEREKIAAVQRKNWAAARA